MVGRNGHYMDNDGNSRNQKRRLATCSVIFIEGCELANNPPSYRHIANVQH